MVKLMEITWIETFTGKKIDPLNFKKEDICMEDIAHSLSMLCRFNGHCKYFYSVAEHSVRVSQLVPDELKPAALLHDSSEAYLSDMPEPTKGLFPQFGELEENILRVIFAKFMLDYADLRRIRWADDAMLATEVRDLMNNIDGWCSHLAPLRETIVPWGQQLAETAFLKEAKKWGIQ